MSEQERLLVAKLETRINLVEHYRNCISNQIAEMNELREELRKRIQFPNKELCLHGVHWDNCPDCNH